MDKERKLIFLSYANEDFSHAHKIREGLINRGLNVWFDKIDLKPGRWIPQIVNAISRSRYFVICLSNAALTKISTENSGFQNEELNLAFQIALGQPDSVFTIVPVRLEKCGRGDSRISMFQQYDLFADFERELDRLAVILGGNPLVDQNIIDTRSEEEISIQSFIGKADIASYLGDYKMLLDNCKAIAKIKPNFQKAFHNKEICVDKLRLHKEARKVPTKQDIFPNGLFKSKKSKLRIKNQESKGFSKTDLVKAIAGKTKLKLNDTEKLVNTFIEAVSSELKTKGKVTLVGFGTFAVAHRKEKVGVNPKTGERIIIKAKAVPVFKPGKALKEFVK